MIDNYGREINYMRISVTDLCNLRCRYCMPEDGVCKRRHEDMMHMDEFITAARAAVSLGVTKIRITGGEPLVKRGIVKFCKELGQLDGLKELCITTNGVLLAQHAQGLKDAGVTRLNISLDTLKADKFTDITRIGDIQTVFDGIEAAKEAGFTDIRMNVVLMKGFNDDEISDFVALTKDQTVDVRFIELMPIGEGLDASDLGYISCSAVLDAVPELEPISGKTTYDGVAQMYKLPGSKGRVGLIRPLSCEFCGSCNKIRLTADGMIKPCLHLEGEYPLKGLSEDEMREVLKQSIMQKPKARDVMDETNRSKAGRNMNMIGG